MSQTSYVRLWHELQAGTVPLSASLDEAVDDDTKLVKAQNAILKPFQANWPQAEFIVADGVADLGKGLSLWDIESVIPPFPVFWVEWCESPDWRASGVRSAGVLCEATRAAHGWDLILRGGARVGPPIGAHRFVMSLSAAHLPITHEGRVEFVDVHKPVGIKSHMPPIENLVINACLAISLMNCKNVTLSWVCPPAKLARSYLRRHAVGLVKFRTINIVPATKLKSTCEMTDAHPRLDVPRQLHNVRGHIKRYDNKGLFGKYKGTYFFSEHLAGDKTRGEKLSRKYTIKPTGGRGAQ